MAEVRGDERTVARRRRVESRSVARGRPGAWWIGLLATSLLACQPDRAKVELPVNPNSAVGACCTLADGSCVVLSSADCAQQGSTRLYRGDNTVCSPNPCSPASGDFVASGQVTTFTEREIKTASGAVLGVPKFAVPPPPGGGEGQMTFSIEKDTLVAPNPPSGKLAASDVYRFGPDGFVFGRPIKLTVPVKVELGDTTGKSFILYRLNQTTGKAEPFGGVYDRQTKSVSAQTYKLSPWFIGSAPTTNTAWGAIEVTNTSTDQWLSLCVVDHTLKYPDADPDFAGDAWSSWAPAGEIGVTNHGLWFVPQGTYRICVEMKRAGTTSAPPGAPRHLYLDGFLVDQPWTHAAPVTVPLSYGSLGVDAQDGPCDCTPAATPSAGTGDVQVTLTWHSALSMDLDLWVTEPDSERCWFRNDSTATGGRLDVDNQCADYVDGRPENIFWSNAPVGEYVVEVDWYSDCGNQISSMGYDVRVVNGSDVRTYTGGITPDQTTEICRFTVTASGAPAGPVFRRVMRSYSGPRSKPPKP